MACILTEGASETLRLFLPRPKGPYFLRAGVKEPCHQPPISKQDRSNVVKRVKQKDHKCFPLYFSFDSNTYLAKERV